MVYVCSEREEIQRSTQTKGKKRQLLGLFWTVNTAEIPLTFPWNYWTGPELTLVPSFQMSQPGLTTAAKQKADLMANVAVLHCSLLEKQPRPWVLMKEVLKLWRV